MRIPILTVTALGAALLGTTVPLLAQTDAGTPSVTTSAPDDRPMPQRLILPTGSAQIGVLTTGSASPKPGQPLDLTFTVSNPTQKPAIYNFPTGQQFDVIVLDTQGNIVWQFSHTRKFSPGLSRVSIAPGQKQAFTTTWNGRDAQGKPVQPGLYTINARLTSNSGTAITGGFLVSTDTDPNNMGIPTKTPADTGAIRQVDIMPPVSASKQVAIGVPPPTVSPAK